MTDLSPAGTESVQTSYSPLGSGIGILEIIHVRVLAGGRFVGRSKRQLIIDPAKATPEDWLVWRSMSSIQQGYCQEALSA